MFGQMTLSAQPFYQSRLIVILMMSFCLWISAFFAWSRDNYPSHLKNSRVGPAIGLFSGHVRQFGMLGSCLSHMLCMAGATVASWFPTMSGSEPRMAVPTRAASKKLHVSSIHRNIRGT
jgi:hypothetical protein